MKRFLEKNTSFFFHAMLIALALLSGVGITLGAGILTIQYALFSVEILLFLTIWASFKMQGRVICGVLCVMVFLCTIVLVGPGNLLPFAKEYYAWMFGTPTENMLWLKIYELFQVCWITAASFCYQRFAEHLPFLRYGAAGAGLGWVLWDMFTHRQLPHLCVICCLTYVVLAYVYWTETHWYKKRCAKNRPFMLWFLPYMLIFLLLLGVTPAPKKPYDWALVKGVYESLREAFLTLTYNWNIGNQEDFDNATIGFSEEGSLSGNIMDDNQEIMEIQVAASLKTNIYLSGKIYDTFHGTRWTQENTSATDDRTLDALETIYAVWRFDKYDSYDYLHPTNLNIKYKLFRTGYLFAPLKSYSITGGKTAYTTEGGNLVLQKRAGYGTAYATGYLQMNLQNALFYELLESPLLEDEEVWTSVQRKYRKDKERYTLSDLEAHRKAVYEVYGTAPDLSPEVTAYLEEITKEAVTDLDKLLAIEAALSKLTYTRTPGSLPSHIDSVADFLDYFLLENKQGNCSHFATAFVLFARAEGIPSRYVEGFCVPVKDESLVTVYGRMAHAWPEVYIDEVGWIPFEPTPGYSKIRYTPWRESIPGTISGTVPTPAPATPTPTPAPTPTRTPAPTMAPVNTQAPAAGSFTLSKPVLLTLIVVLGVLFTVLLLVARKHLRKKRYAQSAPVQKLHIQVQQNLQLLTLLGYKRAANETLQEFQKRVHEALTKAHYLSNHVAPPDSVLSLQDRSQNLPDEIPGSPDREPIQSQSILLPLGFLEIYENVLYGNCPVTQDILLLMLQEREELLELLKKYKRITYFTYRIFAND